MLALLLKQIAGPILLGLFEKLLTALFGWLATRQATTTNVALGQQTARAERLEAEAAANREFEDAKDDLGRLDLEQRRERLRRTLSGHIGPGGQPAR